MARRPTLLLRVEVGEGVGAGHLARSLALARRWIDGDGEAVIASPDLPMPWADRVEAAGVRWCRPDDLPESADWCVADGYRLPAEELADLARRGRLLRIDDFGESESGPARLVLDQNADASADDYPGVEAMVGPRYVLLPPESITSTVREIQTQVRSVVVGLGGFPSPDLRRFADVVLERWAPSADVTILDGRADVDLALADADLVLTAAGSFCWQVCHRGIPSVLVSLAENQERLATGLAAHGVARFVGPAEPENIDRVVAELSDLAEDRSARIDMAARARSLVDGRGTSRVVARVKAEILDLRPVGPDDADLLFAWANDRGTREASFDSTPIDPADHAAWMESGLADPQSMQWIATFAHEPIGLVRFSQPDDGRTEISLTVAPSARGRGWSAPLIVAGTLRARSSVGVREVTARIRSENSASISAFQSADYEPRAVHDTRSSVEYVRRYLDA